MIGLITRPHSIKGELCVQYYADSPFLLKAPLFLLSPDGDVVEIQVKRSTFAKNHLILKLDICSDRNKAETLRNYELCIDSLVMRDILKKYTPSLHQDLHKEDIYVYQLIGLNASYEKKGDEGIYTEFLGVISDVQFIRAQETWTITTANKKEVLIPAVPEFVKEISIQENHVLLTPPEGLVELYIED